MENATKQAPLERSAAAFDPVTKDLLVTNATKPEFCASPTGATNRPA